MVIYFKFCYCSSHLFDFLLVAAVESNEDEAVAVVAADSLGEKLIRGKNNLENQVIKTDTPEVCGIRKVLRGIVTETAQSNSNIGNAVKFCVPNFVCQILLMFLAFI